MKFLSKKITRRKAIGAIGAVAAAAIVGGGAYEYFSSQAPPSAASSSTAAMSSSAAMSSTAAASSSAAGIPVGFIGALSGAAYYSGESQLQGTQLAISMVNKAGGVLGGKPLQLVIGDDQSDPSVARGVVTRMIEQDNIVALTGEYYSYMARSYLDVVDAAGTPFLDQGTSADDIRKKFEPNHFFFSAPNAGQTSGGINLVIQLYQLGKIKHVQAIFTSDESSKNVWDLFSKAFDTAGVPYKVDIVDLNTQDFTSQILAYKSATPRADMLVTGINSAADFLFIKQALSAGLAASTATPYVLEVDGTSEFAPEYWSVVGPAGQYWTSSDYALPPATVGLTPLGKQFESQYVSAYNIEPNNQSFYALDAVTALAAAINAAGSTDKNAIIQALRNMNMPGGLWPLTFPETQTPWWHTPSIPMGVTQFQQVNQDFLLTPAVFPPQVAKAPVVTPGDVADVDFRTVTMTTTY